VDGRGGGWVVAGMKEEVAVGLLQGGRKRWRLGCCRVDGRGGGWVVAWWTECSFMYIDSNLNFATFLFVLP
jgi:hypothetical protein